MIRILLVLHIFITLGLVGLILLQRNEGGGLGAMAGGVFSARGTSNLFTRATAILAAIFMGNCLLMGVLLGIKPKSIIEPPAAQQQKELQVDKSQQKTGNPAPVPTPVPIDKKP